MFLEIVGNNEQFLKLIAFDDPPNNVGQEIIRQLSTKIGRNYSTIMDGTSNTIEKLTITIPEDQLLEILKNIP